MRVGYIGILAALIGFALVGCGDDENNVTPTPTRTASATNTATASATSSPTQTASATPTVTASATASSLPTQTPTGTPDALIVMTDKGPVRGFRRDGARSFLGIPYAAPPVGDLRWRPPVPHAAWTGVRAVNKGGAVCPQTLPIVNLSTGNEDCLFVNVHTPDPPPSIPAPVMVWVHGGGFTVGDGLQTSGLANTGGTDGGIIARNTGVVVVSFNYRLGQFGFLAHSSLTKEDLSHPSSGNYGIEDQIAALHWVQTNIAAFGGDPKNVTIFGESAGGMSVCAHLVSPLSQGLFQRAIIESGPCLHPLSTLVAAEAQGAVFASLLGCDGAADVLACMRAKSAQDIKSTLPPAADFVFSEGQTGYWAPNLDQYIYERQIKDAFAQGAFNQAPVMVGSNKDEGTLFVAMTQDLSGTPLTADEYPDRLKYLLGSDSLVTAVAEHYPLANYATPGAALAAAFGDGFLACPTIDIGALVSAYVPTYLYQFEYPHAHFTLAMPVDMGAFHSAEVQFVFQRPAGLTPVPFTTAERDLSSQMMGYWTRFATTADPNGDGALAWPRYDDARPHLVFDTPITESSDAKGEACGFWSGLDYERPPLPRVVAVR